MCELCDLVALGKRCVVELTGFPEDAHNITRPKVALQAIEACLRLGKQAHDELNLLRMQNVSKTNG